MILTRHERTACERTSGKISRVAADPERLAHQAELGVLEAQEVRAAAAADHDVAAKLVPSGGVGTSLDDHVAREQAHLGAQPDVRHVEAAALAQVRARGPEVRLLSD